MSKNTFLKIFAVVLIVVNIASLIYNVISGNKANKKVKSIRDRLDCIKSNVESINLNFEKLEKEIGSFNDINTEELCNEDFDNYTTMTEGLTDDDTVDKTLQED